MATMDDVINNPRFKSLSVGKQREALSLVSEKYKNAPLEKQNEFLMKHPKINRPVTSFKDHADKIPDKRLRSEMEHTSRLAKTVDITEQEAQLMSKKDIDESGIFSTAGKAFMSGVGDLSRLVGGVLKRVNYLPLESTVGDYLVDEGKRMQEAYEYTVEARMDGFQWRDMLDPEFLASSIMRPLPTSLALIPLNFVGGGAGSAISGAVKLGRFGTYVSKAIGAGVVSRAGESALESQGMYDKAISEGKTKKEAEQLADTVFWNNMNLAGMDAVELATAFMPFKFRPMGKLLRMSATGLKVGAVAGMEGIEERVQEFIQVKAENPETPYSAIFDDQFDEATAVGAIFGLGLGGAGSVYTLFKQEVKNNIKDDSVKQEYEVDQAALGDEEALNKLVEKDEGKKAVDDTIKNLKEKVSVEDVKTEPVRAEKRQKDITEADIDRFIDRAIRGGAPEPSNLARTRKEAQKKEVSFDWTFEELSLLNKESLMDFSKQLGLVAPSKKMTKNKLVSTVFNEMQTTKKVKADIEAEKKGKKVTLEPLSGASGRSLSEAYNQIVEEKGFSSVSITELQKKSNIDIETLKNILKEESRKGNVDLSLGDWSIASQEERAGAIDIDGKPHLLVKFKKDIEIPETELGITKGKMEELLTPEIEKLLGESNELRAEVERLTKKLRAAEKVANTPASKQLKRILMRQKKINAIRDELNLTDNDLRKVTKGKNPVLMSENEYETFIKDVYDRAVEVADTKQAKAELVDLIERKQLKNWESFRKAMKLPPVSKMNAEQLRIFADMMEPFQAGDVFLSQRRLETVDKTDLRGIKTWREAKEKLAQEAGVDPDSIKELTISEHFRDKFRWDSSLAQQNPFYKLLVEQSHKELFNADMKFMEVEDTARKLAKKARKSSKKGLGQLLAPTDERIFEYLESKNKSKMVEQLTDAELEYARYIEGYYREALNYLWKNEALEKGMNDYMTHIRRPFFEAVKNDGLVKAFKESIERYDQDLAIFGILEGQTGDILPLEKHFRFAEHRTGGLTPSKNVTKAFTAYAKLFERKKALDKLIPKMDIYAQSITPEHTTKRGLEMDASVKKFVNKYINNKKGRRISMGFMAQGDIIDHSLRGLRSLTTMLDLGLNLPVGLASFVGESTANFFQLGIKKSALGAKRMNTKKGKRIAEKYKEFVGRSIFENWAAPELGLTEKISTGLFGLFHTSMVTNNKQFLLGSISEQEFQTETISDERLAEMRVDMGRMRVIPDAKSLVGSTSFGGVLMQYKTWAAPIAAETLRDLKTLAKDLKNKPFGEAITTKEAKELMRIVGTITPIIVAGAVLMAEDERDKTYIDELATKMYRESLSVLGGLSPKLWLGVPRVLDFVGELGNNIQGWILADDERIKRLRKQVTPRVIKQALPEREEFKK